MDYEGDGAVTWTVSPFPVLTEKEGEVAVSPPSVSGRNLSSTSTLRSDAKQQNEGSQWGGILRIEEES